MNTKRKPTYDELLAEVERLKSVLAENAKLKNEVAKLKTELKAEKARWVANSVANAIAETRRYHASVLTKSCRAAMM